VPFITFTLLYLFLFVIVVWLLWRQVAASPRVVPTEGSVEPGKEEPVVA